MGPERNFELLLHWDISPVQMTRWVPSGNLNQNCCAIVHTDWLMSSLSAAVTNLVENKSGAFIVYISHSVISVTLTESLCYDVKHKRHCCPKEHLWPEMIETNFVLRFLVLLLGKCTLLQTLTLPVYFSRFWPCLVFAYILGGKKKLHFTSLRI